jgi:hypothetical protein
MVMVMPFLSHPISGTSSMSPVAVWLRDMVRCLQCPPLSPGPTPHQGDDADIEINGESVVGMLREIRDRLNILQVSAEMEAEWDDLRALREQYESKLAECREKSRAWAALKQAG